ncbi:DUF4367 domain-containing protein [Harryflintia acetispora]|uniref:DUF4367 domain-containing protein n=1 Tax=Harryflintia acetispora TaxID=1849041 RepID=UPI001897368D|nr:DUF4367 domain-containing protein [Harryflintia acetispora]
MNDERKLLSEIEENQFRLALRSAAEQEGRELLRLEERIKDNPSYQLSDKRKAAIDRAIARECRKQRGRSCRVRNQIFAMLAALLVLGGVSMSVEAIRVNVFNFLRNIYDTYSRVHSDETDEDPTAADYADLPIPTYLPEGMRIKTPPRADDAIKSVYYQDGQGRYIDYIFYPDGNNLVLDNEGAREETVEIAGQEGTIIERRGGLITIVWGTAPRYQINSDLPRDVLLQVAASVGTDDSAGPGSIINDEERR